MRRLTVLTTIVASMTALTGCAPGGGRISLTAEGNPTTKAGRGEPTLDNRRQPCAWILIDGHAGRFIETDDRKQVQWVIDEPACSTPTFRVEAYKGLLAAPDSFASVLVSYPADEGRSVAYGIAADAGKFKVGRDYPLLNPGLGFVVRNTETQEVIGGVDPLPPGSYVLSAKIEDSESGAKTVAVTQFTVAAAATGEDSN